MAGAALILAIFPVLPGMAYARLAQTAAIPGYTQVTFGDVGQATPHAAAIEQLAAFGIVSGYPNGLFKPNQVVTRAEFAKMIDNALGLRSVADQLESVSRRFGLRGLSAYKHRPFPDVPAGRWYTGFVLAASADGILDGYPDGTFRPDAAIRYDEAVTAVVRALRYVPPPSLGHGWPSNYTLEAGTVADAAGRHELLAGLSDRPAQPLERDDAARLIANMMYSDPRPYEGHPVTDAVVAGPRTPVQRTQSAQLAFQLYYPGADPFDPPLNACYGNVLIATAHTDSTLHPQQVRIESLGGDTCLAATLSPNSTPRTYTLAPRYALVGGTKLDDLVGRQVSFALNGAEQINFIASATPPKDVLAGAMLGTQLAVTSHDGIGHLPASVTQIALAASETGSYNEYRVAPGAIMLPNSGMFEGSGSRHDTVTAVLNPDGKVIALIDRHLFAQS